MFKNFIEWFKTSLNGIGVFLTIAGLIFGGGVFYNRFNALEDNITMKMQYQEKFIQSVTDQQTARIENLEYKIIMRTEEVKDKVVNVNREVLRNRIVRPPEIIRSTIIYKDGSITRDSIKIKSD